MGVRLSIEIVSPLQPDDRDMLTGLSIMVMAIANHELAKEHFPGVFPSPDEIAEQQRQDAAAAAGPMPCMAEREGRHCVGEAGHQGRHTYRRILPPTGGLN